MYSDVFVPVLRSFTTGIYILPSSVNTAGRRGVLFCNLPVHTFILTLTIVFMAQENKCLLAGSFWLIYLSNNFNGLSRP